MNYSLFFSFSDILMSCFDILLVDLLIYFVEIIYFDELCCLLRNAFMLSLTFMLKEDINIKIDSC